MANQIVVNAKSVKSKIDKNIYGHFSEHPQGQQQTAG